jgi:hypothetical protein
MKRQAHQTNKRDEIPETANLNGRPTGDSMETQLEPREASTRRGRRVRARGTQNMSAKAITAEGTQNTQAIKMKREEP